MENLVRWSLILELVSELKKSGSWCGETHIQKSTFFLQEMFNVPLKLDYIIYKYGPYSFQLNDDLTALRAYDYLKIISLEPFGVTYELFDQENKLKKFFNSEIKKYSSKIKKVAAEFGIRNVVELERLATAYYLYKINGEKKLEKVAKSVHDIKPHVPYDLALKSIKEVLEITK